MAPEDTTLTTSQLIRERAAWFDSGAQVASGYGAIATLVLTALGGLLAAVFRMDASEAVISLGVTVVLVQACVAGWLHFTARQRAVRGGVHVDTY